MAEFDRLVRNAFLQAYGYGETKEYFFVKKNRRYNSKAIFAAAYQRQHGFFRGS